MGSMSDAYAPTFDPFGAHTSIPQESVDGGQNAVVATVEGAVGKVLGNPYVWVGVGLVLLFTIK